MIDGIDRNAVEEEVKAQIDYDCLMSFKDDSVVKMVEEIKDLMVDVLCGERTVISEGKRVSEETAKAAYRKITFEHVQYVLHSLVNYPDKDKQDRPLPDNIAVQLRLYTDELHLCRL